ncbi:hypothetical protein [Nitrincola alkalisediminis]|uniref:hypothetical protein n=1 Tax=Nitrincola alkalisediminis TaxID=1366656 RepID=UPI001873CB8E|nr:hypothetical protein [Nitrincola alkalisediminis]
MSKLSTHKVKWLRWLKWGLVLIVVLLPLDMALWVSNTPSFDGGKAYMSYSPDGQYRVGSVYISEENRLKGGARSYFLLTDATGKHVYAFIPMPRDWESTGDGAAWLCGESMERCHSENNVVVTGFWNGWAGADELFEVSLPVSTWRRIHAWLAVRNKGMQDAEFAEMIVR